MQKDEGGSLSPPAQDSAVSGGANTAKRGFTDDLVPVAPVTLLTLQE